MKAAQYSVIAFPKLDNETQLQRLREKFGSWSYDLRPYLTIVPPFTPLTLDELQHITEHISAVRKKLHPLAVSFSECVAAKEAILLIVSEGRERIAELVRAVHGSEALTIAGIPEQEPALWLGKVVDPRQLDTAVAEVNRLRRTIGIVDSLSFVRGTADDSMRLVLTMPFGIGRVDYHERFPA